MAGDIQVLEKPVGSEAEIKELGLDPRRYGSCSPRSGENKGCPWYTICRFHSIREKGRPDNIGIKVVLGSGAAADMIMPCFDYYYSGLDARQKNAERSGDSIDPRFRVGDKMKLKGTTKLHEQRDPNCPNCQSGTCVARKKFVRETIIKPLPPARDLLSEAAYAASIRMQMQERLNQEEVAVKRVEQEQAQKVAPIGNK